MIFVKLPQTRSLRPDQLLADERSERIYDRRAQHLRGELRDCPFVEDVPCDRGALDDGSLVRAEPVEPGGEKRVDCGRHPHRADVPNRRPVPILSDEEPVVDQHREHLFDEERIALRRCRDCVSTSSASSTWPTRFAIS